MGMGTGTGTRPLVRTEHPRGYISIELPLYMNYQGFFFFSSRPKDEKERTALQNLQSNKVTDIGEPLSLQPPQFRFPFSFNLFELNKIQIEFPELCVAYHQNCFAWRSSKYFTALDTCGNTNNPEADHEGSYLHPLRCQWPPTWPLPHPSPAACRGQHPSIASLHLQESLGNTGESLASDSAV